MPPPSHTCVEENGCLREQTLAAPTDESSDTESVNVERPGLPTAEEWHRWGVEVIAELHAGKQSRVFDVVIDGQRIAAKLTEARLADPAVYTARLEAVEALGTEHRNVVPPQRIDGQLMLPIGEWLMTATPFIEGDRLDAGAASDAMLLGQALADLHGALSRLGAFDIPAVAALAATGQSDAAPNWQLLHGDFSCQNVIRTPVLLRVIDFDDCGYGPVEYDIANSLYMVLFDSEVAQRPELYETFRPAFLDGYAAETDHRVGDDDIDALIARRIDALAWWLNNLSEAPIGIRTSSDDWLETLAAFVQSIGSADDR
jgi:Ser/Thr protein kinase RdoA (MazF antagonist)